MTQGTPGFRILVVEDEVFSRGMLGRLLKDLGAEHVVFAGSGDEARAMIAEDAGLRMIVADHYMAGGSGIALLGDLRQGKLPLPHDTYFIVATSSTSFALTAVALTLDADSFLSKPFSRTVLAERMYQFLMGSRTIKPVEYYGGIDVTAMLAAAENLDPTAPAKPAAKQRLTPIGRVLPDTPLASDLLVKDGTVLLHAGTVLTRHLIARLIELGIEAVPAPLPKRRLPSVPPSRQP
jgi:CheY-like chemotaxis protein